MPLPKKQIKKNRQACVRAITFNSMSFEPYHIDFLNALNDELEVMSHQIVDKGMRDYELFKMRLSTQNEIINDFEYEVKVSYFTSNADGEVLHETSVFHGRETKGDSLLTNMSLDWMCVTGGPELKNRCCWLYHDLLDHARVGVKIFDINSITVEAIIIEQVFRIFKNNTWQEDLPNQD